MTPSTDYATDTYAFDGLLYLFRSGKKILLTGRVEVECGQIPDVVDVEVRDAAEPHITYRTRIERGHPIHRHIRNHVAGGLTD